MVNPTDALIKRIRRLVEGATPDWDIKLGKFHESADWPANFDVDGGKILSFGMDGEEGIYADNAVDVLLIASAPTDLALLCDMLEIAMKTLDEVEADTYPESFAERLIYEAKERIEGMTNAPPQHLP